MSKQRISTSLAPEVEVERIGGSLQVKGWDEAEVVVQADPDILHLEEQDDAVRLSCDGDCEIRLPSGASLHVGEVAGEARLRFLEDSLAVDTVHGSLFLRNVAETRVETVHGEVMARGIAGDLAIGAVHGNLILRDLQGALAIEAVMGNLDLRDVEGDIRAACEGNARLRLSSISGGRYEIQAAGNIHCRIPEDASLRLEIRSAGEMISLKLPGGSQVYRQENFSQVLGSGEAILEIAAGGSVYLSVREAGGEEDEPPAGFEGFSRLPDDLGEKIGRQVEAQIEAQMEMMNRQLNEQMAHLNAAIDRAGLSAEESERIIQRARERSERAAAQAQEKVRRAQEQIERKIESTRRREEQRNQSWGARFGRGAFHVNFPPTPPVPPKEAVSNEERLVILRMLEQKKISLEDAEQLLAALEGKES